MKHTTRRIAALLAIIVAALAASCTSATVRTQSGTMIHLANVAGKSNIASVTADGVTIQGFQSDNGQSAQKLLSTWGWMKFWTGQGGDAARDLTKGAADVATKAVQ